MKINDLEQYEDRIVLYLDILGFSNKIKGSSDENESFENIKELLNKLENQKELSDKWNNENDTYDFQVSLFSDSLIISVPLKIKNGFYDLVKAAIFVMHDLIYSGFIARGGITVGKFYHSGNVAFGPALIEAVELEKNAKYTKIILTKNIYNRLIMNLDNNEYQEITQIVLRDFVVYITKDEEYFLD